MKFRVTFTQNLETVYKEDGRDTRISLYVEGKTFKEAEVNARGALHDLVLYTEGWHMVRLKRVDIIDDSDPV